jgi:hypothetical protein
MRKTSARIKLPVTQWWSGNGWCVQKRTGVADRYEVTHDGQFIAAVAVTRAGWKWTARNHLSRSYLRPWMWSEEIYPTWQEAVAAYARVYRRLAYGRGAKVPETWAPSSLLKSRPWIPRPVHDSFDELTAQR